ncbi:hypothetical protein [Sporomusa aerivorans]|uniref:hypothetical protein n=1 Tax=Sporomusa aerivorans TaxID=204936 RepID=UPI00352B3C3B
MGLLTPRETRSVRPNIRKALKSAKKQKNPTKTDKPARHLPLPVVKFETVKKYQEFGAGAR